MFATFPSVVALGDEDCVVAFVFAFVVSEEDVKDGTANVKEIMV